MGNRTTDRVKKESTKSPLFSRIGRVGVAVGLSLSLSSATAAAAAAGRLMMSTTGLFDQRDCVCSPQIDFDWPRVCQPISI